MSPFALATIPVTDSETTEVELEFDPVNADVLYELSPLMRGTGVPLSMYNLNGQNYTLSGSFAHLLYTNYYFYPNASGKLYYNLTVTWPSQSMVQKGISVTCWDKTTNTQVTDTSFSMSLDPFTQLYGPSVHSNNRVLSNLDNTHQYYLIITKATDSITATLSGTISA
jgi:hypothetical protein